MPGSDEGRLPIRGNPMAGLAEAAQLARDYVCQAKAANTIRAYAADWRHFTAWCHAQDLPPAPAAPETIALYLSGLASTAKVSTLTRRVSAISQAHQLGSHASPTRDVRVRAVMAGIRRVKGTGQEGKKPILTADLRRMCEHLAEGPQGARDRAMLLLGFAGAFRRSELVALDIDDLAFGAEGLVVSIRRSKVDQEGQGRKVGIPCGLHPQTCPVGAVEAWLGLLDRSRAPVFRSVDRHGHIGGGRLSDRAVALVVKRAAANAGLSPAELSGHSLRAGLATAAAAAGVGERAIMAQTGHRSLTTLRKYIREGSLFLENAAGAVGL